MGDKMLNLYELSQVIGEPLVVEVRADSFNIQFKNSEVKDYKSSSVLYSSWGQGETVDVAADDLFKKINGKWLVFDATSENRREFCAKIAQKETNLENINQFNQFFVTREFIEDHCDKEILAFCHAGGMPKGIKAIIPGRYGSYRLEI